MEARHVQEGTLGCPVCHTEYAIRDGIVDLRLDAEKSAAPSKTRDGERVTDHVTADALAAMLNLADALGFAVLVGDWGRHAEELLELEPVPPLLLVDPPADVVIVPGLSGVRSGPVLPIATGAARGVAVDGTDAARLASAAHAARAGGRVVAPAHAPVPEGVRELARDEHVWVAERMPPTSPLVRLHVRRG
jgi:hypothetical protein